MNIIFQEYLKKIILVFFDDILIYSKNCLDHLNHVRIVFSILKDNQPIVKKEKCQFAQ